MKKIEDGFWQSKRKDGSVYNEGFYINNVREGLWENYIDNALTSEGHYYHGEKSGYWTYYF